MRPTGNISSLAPAPWYRQGETKPHFIFTLENGAYEVVIDENKMYQNYFTEIIQDMDIKYLIHLRNDQYLAYPKWDKRVRLVSMIGKHGSYRKGTTLLRDVEYTQGSLPLPGKPPSGRKNEELWHIGKAGREIFLTDIITERSYVLWKGKDFSYNNFLQIVRVKD